MFSVILHAIVTSYALWLLFLAMMALQWRWELLPNAVKVIALPAVLLAITLDVLFNYTIACVLFLKLPARGEWTFSQRVGHYKRRIDWRAPIAHWICANLLDPFEAGGHCKG